MSAFASFEYIAQELGRGAVIPVLGAGANLCDRPPGVTFEQGTYLPDGRELAEALVARFPGTQPGDLARVAMHVIALAGAGPLFDTLHEMFDADYQPNRLHGFLVDAARRVRTSTGSGMLLVTTNYDDALERAFQAADEPYQLITYIAGGRHRGYFRHHLSESESVLVDPPTTYLGFRFTATSVIAKIHGAVRRTAQSPDREDLAWDPESYVITEDQYVDYISHMNRDLFPVTLGTKLKKSHLLFLGYSLRDWNFRVLLHRIREEQADRDYQSWAIQPKPDAIDRFAWKQRGIEILSLSCGDFLDEMKWPRPDGTAP